jgi:tetratricopeptide (TPR) repeat protein
MAHSTEPAPPPDSSAAHWQQAQEAFAAHDLVLARSHLERCLQGWPLDAETSFLLARTCRRSDDLLSWQTYLHRAEALQWSKEDLRLEQLLMAVQSGGNPQAEQNVLALLDKPRGDETLLVEALVKGYLETFRLRDALTWANSWHERHPDDPLPWLYRGRVSEVSQRPGSAINDYTQALTLQPDLAEAHLSLAGMQMVRNRFGEALEHYQAYLEKRPNGAGGLVGAANCQLALGHPEKARPLLDTLLARYPDNAAGLFLRAKLEVSEGRPAEALKWLEQADARSPNETDITYTFVLVYRQLGQPEKAKQYERKVNDLRAQLARVDGLKKQVLSEPANAALRHQVGALCLQVGKQDEAVRWLESVLTLDPDHRATHKLLADYYHAHGDEARAAYHRDKTAAK